MMALLIELVSDLLMKDPRRADHEIGTDAVLRRGGRSLGICSIAAGTPLNVCCIPATRSRHTQVRRHEGFDCICRMRDPVHCELGKR